MPSPLSNEKYDSSKPWWDQSETFARWFALKEPYQNVFVGCDPLDGMTKEDAQSFDAIVNVSSTKCAVFEPARPDQRTYWFPIIELGRWPIVYLLWLKETLDYHYSKGHRVYLHCHAGAYRSPSAAILWLQSRGLVPSVARYVCRERSPYIYKLWESHGNIPRRKDELFDLFKERQAEIDANGYGSLCVESLLTYASFDPKDQEVLSGHAYRYAMLRHYFWFWYEPRWWLSRKLDELDRWLIKRFGRIDNHYYPRKHFWSTMSMAEPQPEFYQVNDHAWIDGKWKKIKEFELRDKKYAWRWLVDKCEPCDGQGFTVDQEKPIGHNRTWCEHCGRTGVKR